MVNLGGATLDISGTIMAPFMTDIVLIDSSLGVAGTFDGLAEGDAVTINDVEFRITYQGGATATTWCCVPSSPKHR